MRYLRLYSENSSFESDEQTAGGTGNDIESMVPGVVKTVDNRKIYFNPHDKTVQFHTLTIYYENSNGEQLAECKTMMVKYISGVTQKIVVTPKNIDGYIARKQKIVANIPEDASIVFYYKVEADYSKPLTFNIISAGTIVWRVNQLASAKSIEYKKNDGEWTTITSNTGASAPSISVNAGDAVQFRGDNVVYAVSPSYYNMFVGTAKFEVEGNIMSLINSKNFATATTLVSSYTFYNLFNYCTGLTSAENLVLPATTLADGCYSGMFGGCTSLTTAPELPATTLANQCYSGMFNGCTGLTTAPELPATTLTNYCYSNMFGGCTSLTTAPELPATALTYYCYNYMFSNCTSLTTAPELPATTLTDYCYRYMFNGCTSLNYIKCLATDITADSCTYDWVRNVAATGTFVKDPNMSSWRTGVNGIPTNWSIKDYGFVISRSIVTLSEIASAKTITITSSFNNWTATTNDDWYGLSQYTGGTGETTITITANTQNINRTGTVTFTDGTNVETLTVNEKHLIETPLTFNIISAGTIYWKAYNNSYRLSIEYKKNNGNWTSITATTGGTSIFVNDGDVVQFRGDNVTYATGTSMYNTFSGTTARFDVEGNIMSFIDSTNFATATTLVSSYTFYYLFYQCTGLTSAENLVLPATGLLYYCYGGMFYGCSSLTTAPELPATTLASYCYCHMFRSCTSLTTAPELPVTTLAYGCYSGMFWGCTSLTAAPELPATTPAYDCYQEMFRGCTSLTSAPELPATTLANGCYSSMFSNCTSLTSAPELPATTLANNCYFQMFCNCTSLTTAPELPATTLATQCYSGMFDGCTSLTTAPELPATTLTERCYSGMFGGCSGLTTAPELPATTLANYCYGSMFNGCRSLTTAPELPATTLTIYCYNGMFSGCTNLNYIKCLATDISASNCTTNWTRGVASTGTFEKSSSITEQTWGRGVSRIPNNWTVVDAT